VTGPHSVTELVAKTGLSPSRISNHLAWCRFVHADRHGRRVVYTIADTRLRQLLDLADDLVADNAEHLATCTRIGPDWTINGQQATGHAGHVLSVLAFALLFAIPWYAPARAACYSGPSSQLECCGGGMRISEVAGRAGVPPKTIRYWEDQQLLPEPARTAAGYRDYDPAILDRLAFIRHAQAAGFTLGHIRQVLDIRDGGRPPCVHVSVLIARRLGEVEARLAELVRTRDQLAALAGRAAAQDLTDCQGYCSIITG
jgi:MerR family transcriptional regulator, copper efflux regulator